MKHCLMLSLKLVFAPNWMSISRIATCCILAAATRSAGDTDIAGRHVSTLNLKPHHTASDLGLLGRGLLLGRLFGGAKVLVAVVVAAVRLPRLATLQCTDHSLHSSRPPEMTCLFQAAMMHGMEVMHLRERHREPLGHQSCHADCVPWLPFTSEVLSHLAAASGSLLLGQQGGALVHLGVLRVQRLQQRIQVAASQVPLIGAPVFRRHRIRLVVGLPLQPGRLRAVTGGSFQQQSPVQRC